MDFETEPLNNYQKKQFVFLIFYKTIVVRKIYSHFFFLLPFPTY